MDWKVTEYSNHGGTRWVLSEEAETEINALTAERDRLLSTVRRLRLRVEVADETSATFHANWVEFWSWFGREMPHLSKELWRQWKQHAGEWRQ